MEPRYETCGQLDLAQKLIPGLILGGTAPAARLPRTGSHLALEQLNCLHVPFISLASLITRPALVGKHPAIPLDILDLAALPCYARNFVVPVALAFNVMILVVLVVFKFPGAQLRSCSTTLTSV